MEEAGLIAVGTTRDAKTHLAEVRFVLFDEKTAAVFAEALASPEGVAGARGET